MASTATGLLYVLGETGPEVLEDEFNDWYDNEHGPLRIAIRDIYTATRYRANDGLKPTYVAVYDGATPETFQTPPYTALAATASPREKTLIPKLSLLNRQIYSLVSTFGGYTEPSKYLLVVSVSLKPGQDIEDDFNKWYDEDHIPVLKKVPGWMSSRRFKLVSSVELAKGEGLDKEKPQHTYIALHRLSDLSLFQNEDLLANNRTPWAKRIAEESVTDQLIRVFVLHKNITQ